MHHLLSVAERERESKFSCLVGVEWLLRNFATSTPKLRERFDQRMLETLGLGNLGKVSFYAGDADAISRELA